MRLNFILRTGEIMEDFVAQPENLNFQEGLRYFLIISVIGFFVSLIFNRRIKRCPTLAAELSILATLFVYPTINFYLRIATMSGYALEADVAGFPHSPLIFFFPLPVCLLVCVMFCICREKKIIASSETLASAKSWTKARIAALVLSVLAGGLWLCFAMVSERSFHVFTVLRFLVYTVCGFAAYLVVEFILWIIRLLFARGGRQESERV